MKPIDMFLNLVGMAFSVLLGLLLALLFCTGCVSPGSQPAKSQTMTVRDCTIAFNVYGGDATNAVPFTLGDMIAQNQYLESAGTETYSPTATPTQTISPETTVTLSKSGASSSALASLLTSAASSLTAASPSSSSSSSASSGSTAEAAADAGTEAE